MTENSECERARLNQRSPSCRWFFDKSGEARGSRAFIANGLLMIVAFFLGRIIFIPYFYYKTFSVWSSPARSHFGPLLPVVWIFTAGILDIINVYWFFKMLRGGAKLLLRPGNEKKSEWCNGEGKDRGEDLFSRRLVTKRDNNDLDDSHRICTKILKDWNQKIRVLCTNHCSEVYQRGMVLSLSSSE